MSLSSDLTAIKNLSDGVKNNKVTRFAYTQNAYNNNDVNGHSDYVYDRDNNIPTADLSVIEVNPTVVDKGFRARASSLPRMLLNHLFGRISYNLNKVNDLFNELLVKVMANMGVANGLATLDANGRIPYSQLPEDAMEYQGEWNAQTNTPHLADGTGTRGDTYNVSVAGTQNLGSGSITFFVGDRVIYNENGVWQRLESGNVQSVCDILPDTNTTNVDLTQQIDIRKILNADFLSKLFIAFMGNNWVQGTIGNRYSMQCPIYANGIWVAGGQGDGIWWSEDGKHWTRGTGILSNSSQLYISCINGLWLSSGGRGMWWSEDGKNWTQGTGDNTTYQMQKQAYANGLWVVGSYNHGIWWSEDGKSWTQGTGTNLSTAKFIESAVYANGIWVTGSQGSGMWWSEDGKAWSRTSGATSTNLRISTIVHANGLWLAGNDTNGMIWSEDGKVWTRCTIPNSYTISHIVYANGIWVASSTDHGMWWSEDGKSWTQGTGDNTAYTMFAVIYANGLWVAGSYANGAWWSTDGKTWTQGTGDNTAHQVNNPIYASNIWLAEGSSQGMWRSIDGKNWERATVVSGDSAYMNYPFYANGICVCGGASVWYSDPIEYIDGE